jgi:hypothetical protein
MATGKKSYGDAKRLWNRAFGRRLRALRLAIHGGHGGHANGGVAMAATIGVSARSLYGWELGSTMPGEVFLRLLDETGASPGWFLTGDGPMFDAPAVDPAGVDVRRACSLVHEAADRLRREARRRQAKQGTPQ